LSKPITKKSRKGKGGEERGEGGEGTSGDSTARKHMQRVSRQEAPILRKETNGIHSHSRAWAKLG